MFLAKYDVNGTVLWVKSAGDESAEDAGYSVAVDVTGNAYITGWFDSPTITFGTYTLMNAGVLNMFTVIYDVNGYVLWATSVGGTWVDKGLSVAVDAFENAYITGEFASPTINFGVDTLKNVTTEFNNDIFLAKLSHGEIGISKVNHTTNILVYPNPVTDKIAIKLPDENAGGIISIV